MRDEWRKWVAEQQVLIREHNAEKAELLAELRALRKAQNPNSEQLQFEIQKTVLVTSGLEDEVVRMQIQVDQVQVSANICAIVRFYLFFPHVCVVCQEELNKVLRRMDEVHDEISLSEKLNSEIYEKCLNRLNGIPDEVGDPSRENFEDDDTRHVRIVEESQRGLEPLSTSYSYSKGYIQPFSPGPNQSTSSPFTPMSHHNQGGSWRDSMDDLVRAPPSIIEAFHTPHHAEPQRHRIGRATTLVAGPYHPVPDHPLGPNSASSIRMSRPNVPLSTKQRSRSRSPNQQQLIVSSGGSVILGAGEDDYEDNYYQQPATLGPQSSSAMTPTPTPRYLGGSRDEHPLRVALKTCSNRSSGLVRSKGFDFGPRTASPRAGFMLPPRLADSVAQHTASTMRKPVTPGVSAIGESPLNKARFATHTGSSIQKGNPNGAAGPVTGQARGMSGWR